MKKQKKKIKNKNEYLEYFQVIYFFIFVKYIVIGYSLRFRQ
jgi:hypothetical protein